MDTAELLLSFVKNGVVYTYEMASGQLSVQLLTAFPGEPGKYQRAFHGAFTPPWAPQGWKIVEIPKQVEVTDGVFSVEQIPFV